MVERQQMIERGDHQAVPLGRRSTPTFLQGAIGRWITSGLFTESIPAHRARGSFSVASVRDTPIVATRRRRFSIAACATLPGNALNSFCRASPYAARAVADSGHASKTDKRLVVK